MQRITVGDLRKQLARLPDNLEVLVNRGDWGPCRVHEQPRIALVQDSGAQDQLWEVMFPELEFDPDLEAPRKTVVLL